jgi:hypothetical protein
MMILLAALILAQTRIASDFELQQMQRQVENSRDFVSQLSGHLNIGDLRLARNETTLARAEYAKALEIASSERLAARRNSDLTRYATATSYAALAQAKLGDAADAFTLAEEAMRYSGDSAKSWNLYASTMSQLGMPAKAASASRNAVAIASRENDPLDLAIDKYSLASALGDTAEAEQLLVDVVKSLRSETFADLRRQVARTESFEIYSTARGDVAAYISILNRSQLRLARLYEDRGDLARARQQYVNVLADRSDEPTALAAMARLEPTDEHFKAAFDANPFSISLIRDYQNYLSGQRAASSGQEAETTGDQVRLALQQVQRGELPAALATMTAVEQKFPNNDTLALLRREIEQKRSAFLAAYQNPAQLDKETRTGTVIFDQGPPFETGQVDGIRFRFSEPMNFSGNFAAHVPLRLTYRILGPTQLNGADALLLEPLRLEPLR